MAGYWSASDDERLPWLEPYRETRARKSAPVAARKRDAGMVVGAMAAIATALTAGYYIGQRDPPVAAPLDEVALAPVSTAPPAPIAPPLTVQPLPPVMAEPVPTKVAVAAPSKANEGERETSTAPGPAGQVIQLGAFREQSGANRAYRIWTARYPVLGSMPHVVLPVVSKSRGQVLYVLRLGTTSRQQSRIVCSYLRASGEQCLVIG